MKTLQYLFFGAVATLLMAADCSNKDSEFYNDVFVSTPNLVDIDSNPTLGVDQPVMIRADFSKVISEQNQTTGIDLFRTTGGARSFTFSYLIEKKVGDTWEPVNIAENSVVNDNGLTLSYGDFVLAQSVFDTELQSYEYHGGVRLSETGDYRLRFTYNNPPSASLVLTSDSFSNNLLVTIYSTCADTDEFGYYYFSVIG